VLLFPSIADRSRIIGCAKNLPDLGETSHSSSSSRLGIRLPAGLFFFSAVVIGAVGFAFIPAHAQVPPVTTEQGEASGSVKAVASPTKAPNTNNAEPMVPPIRRVHPSRVTKEAKLKAKALQLRDASSKKRAAKVPSAGKAIGGEKIGSAAVPAAKR